MSTLFRCMLFAVVCGLAAPARGAQAPALDPSAATQAPIVIPDFEQGELAPEPIETLESSIGKALEGTAAKAADSKLTTAVEIAILLTVLSVLPAVLITVTSFTRIVIVLSFVRRALSTNELPPTPVVIGLSLFLTTFVMAPVGTRIWEKAWQPYQQEQVSLQAAGAVAWDEMSQFLVANTRESELKLFADLADFEPAETGQRPPLRVVVPAFVLSELKTAFQMGFLLFLPFLVVDLVISTVLLSMGMFMLPPVMISTPFKILLFVLVDGWHLVCQSLVTSFQAT